MPPQRLKPRTVRSGGGMAEESVSQLVYRPFGTRLCSTFASRHCRAGLSHVAASRLERYLVPLSFCIPSCDTDSLVVPYAARQDWALAPEGSQGITPSAAEAADCALPKRHGWKPCPTQNRFMKRTAFTAVPSRLVWHENSPTALGRWCPRAAPPG